MNIASKWGQMKLSTCSQKVLDGLLITQPFEVANVSYCDKIYY